MISAALDTSFGAALALRCNQELLCHEQLSLQGRDSDRRLVPWILDHMAVVGITPRQVARWTVGTGPGSFSGLRVGIAFVKGICTGSDALLRGIPSSFALAGAAAAKLAQGDHIGVLHDARRHKLILSTYRKRANGLCLVSEPCVTTADELHMLSNRFSAFVTPHPQAAMALLSSALHEKLIVVEELDANLLLDAPDKYWPSSSEEAEKGCEPVYVRPAVFVNPKPPQVPGVNRL